MIYTSTYKAAQSVAPQIEAHFQEALLRAQELGELNLATLPNRTAIEAILDAAFWTSLRKEEGHSPKISFAYLAPEQAHNPMLFNKALAFTPQMLSKIAPGLEGAGIHLGVWHSEDGFYIWGTTLNIPNFCFVVDVSEPGLLVVKHRRIYGIGKYTNVAVLRGDQVSFIDDKHCKPRAMHALVRALLDLTELSSWNDPRNVLIQLALGMRKHKRGGIIIMVPQKDEEWKNSILHPLLYGLDPYFNGLAQLIKLDGDHTSSSVNAQSALQREVEHIAGLTAIDGATILTDNFELIAFGTKIGRGHGKSTVEQIALVEPITNGGETVVYPGQLGGTRHFSAAQFVHDQPQSICLVASQDGHFTLFYWNDARQMVMANRLDTLLL